MTDETSVQAELNAMRKTVVALEPLNPAARDRVVSWLFDRYRITVDDELKAITDV